MFDSAFTSVEKLFTEFSIKRLFFVLLLVLIALAGLYGYERYTQQFELGRIEKTANILKQLHEMRTDGKTDQDPEGEAIRSKLMTELEDTMAPTQFALPSGKPVLKLLAGGSLWFLLALFFLWRFKHGDVGSRDGFAGCVFFAIIFSMIGIALPDNFYLNYVFYPLSNFAMVIALAFRFSK